MSTRVICEHARYRYLYLPCIYHVPVRQAGPPEIPPAARRDPGGLACTGGHRASGRFWKMPRRARMLRVLRML